MIERLSQLLLLVLVCWSAAASADPAALAFVGVQDRTDGDPHNVRALEADLSSVLKDWTELVVRTPEEIDRDIGEARRILILSDSRSGAELREAAAQLVPAQGSTVRRYALVATIGESEGHKTVGLTLWLLSTGERVWEEDVQPPRKLSDALTGMRAQIARWENEKRASEQDAALQQLKAASKSAPPEVRAAKPAPAPEEARPAVPSAPPPRSEAPAMSHAESPTAPPPVTEASAPARSTPPPAQTAAPAVVVDHSPVTEAEAFRPLSIEATIDAHSPIDVFVYYRPKGHGEWLSANMIPFEGRYIGALSPLPPGEVEYYISVLDQAVNEVGSHGSQAHPHVVRFVKPLEHTPPAVERPRAAPAAPPVVIVRPPRIVSPPVIPVQQPRPAVPVNIPRVVGIAGVTTGAAGLVVCAVLGAMGRHQSDLIESGSLANGMEIGHAQQLTQKYDTASLVSGILGAVISGVGVWELLPVRHWPSTRNSP